MVDVSAACSFSALTLLIERRQKSRLSVISLGSPSDHRAAGWPARRPLAVCCCCCCLLLLLLGRLLQVDLITLGGLKCRSVRPSVHKKFFRLQ